MKSHHPLFPLSNEIRIFLLVTALLLLSAFAFATIRMDAVLIQGGALYVPMYSLELETFAAFGGISILTLLLAERLVGSPNAN